MLLRWCCDYFQTRTWSWLCHLLTDTILYNVMMMLWLFADTYVKLTVSVTNRYNIIWYYDDAMTICRHVYVTMMLWLLPDTYMLRWCYDYLQTRICYDDAMTYLQTRTWSWRWCRPRARSCSAARRRCAEASRTRCSRRRSCSRWRCSSSPRSRSWCPCTTRRAWRRRKWSAGFH